MLVTFLAARAATGLVFAAMIVGTTLVIATACVINNYLDQDIDAKMERTKNALAWLAWCQVRRWFLMVLYWGLSAWVYCTHGQTCQLVAIGLIGL